MGTVYLLHFDEPIGGESSMGKAQHYLGQTNRPVEERLQEHRSGNGARITQVLRERGIGFCLARTWEGDRSDERRLKDRHDNPRLCPICREEHEA